MCYNDEIVKDVLKAQLWLLPCLTDLFGLSMFCAKKLNSTSFSSAQEMADASCVEDLKRVSYDLIVATTGRASWLMTWVDQCPSPNLFNLRDQGSQTLFLIYKYNKSNFALKCTPDSPIEVTHLVLCFILIFGLGLDSLFITYVLHKHLNRWPPSCSWYNPDTGIVHTRTGRNNGVKVRH